MAEGKALGKDDLFEKDVFQNATKGAQELLSVIKETQDTIKGSLTAQKEFVSTFKAKSYDDVKRLNTAIAETNTLIKQKEQLTKAELVIQQQSEKLAQEQLKTQREEIKNQQIIEKQNKATEKSLNALNGEYARAVKSLSEVKKQLKELEFTGRNNGKLFKALSTEFDTLNKSVRGAEQRVGEFQRNVGNYASGFSPLSNSINQLTREMPAFANSVQTGFMAISNNIPAFFDAIKGLKEQNKILRAEGKETQSILSSLGTAFFSWGTALSVGVTLLTVYGKEIVNFVIEIMKGKDAMIAVNEVLATTYKESTKLIRENTAALLDLLEAQGKITKQQKENFLIEKDLNVDRKMRDAAYLKERREFATKLGLELDKEGNLIKRRRTEIQYSTRESAMELIESNKLYNFQRKKLEEDYLKGEKKLYEVYLTDIENMEKKEVIDSVEKNKKERAQTKEHLDSLQSLIRQYEIAVIADEYIRRRAQVTEEYRLGQISINRAKTTQKEKNEALIALEKKYYFDLQKIDEEEEAKRLEFAKKKAQEFLDLWNKNQEDIEKARLEKAQKARKEFEKLWKQKLDEDKKAVDSEKKKTQELIREMDKIEKYVEMAINRRNKLENDRIDREQKLNQDNQEIQQRLAEKGLQNTLAFEKEKSAELELERKRQQEKEIRQQKIFAFYNLFSSYAKTDPNTALQKAIVDTALAEVISGSFIEGTENVERDLKGNKVHNGEDGYVVAVDGRERILNPKQNEKLGNISNNELVGIVEDYKRGVLFNYGNVNGNNTTILQQNIDLSPLSNKLDVLIDITQNKPVHQTNIDNLGNIVNATIRNNVKTIVTHKNRLR